MQKYTFFFMSLIDPLHNGAGEGLGLIDRPIIRERTTHFPYIQPTSIKGVFRSFYNSKFITVDEKHKLYALFGPDTDNADSHEGALSFGEGQLLAFPVRSFQGCFVWATSPLALQRFSARMSLNAGTTLSTLTDSFLRETMAASAPLICNGSKSVLTVSEKLLLEEIAFTPTESTALKGLAEELAPLIFSDSFLSEEFKRKLVLLPDDSFRHFVVNATEVVPNIRIEDSGVTKDGSLRYSEYLPRESVMYCLVTHDKAKKPSKKYSYDITSLGLETPDGVKRCFDATFPSILQIGGNETTGKGLVKLKRW